MKVRKYMFMKFLLLKNVNDQLFCKNNQIFIINFKINNNVSMNLLIFSVS